MSGAEDSPLASFPLAVARVVDGRIDEVSLPFAALVGRRAATLTGTALADLVAPEDRRPLAAALDGGAVADIGVSGRRDDGLPFVVTFSTAPWADGGCLVLALRRGPPIVSATDQPGPAEPGRDVVDSAVSHDLRGALRGVIGFLSLLDRNADALPDEAKGFLDTARRSAATADHMAEQLVHYIRVGQRPLPVSAVGLDDVVAEATSAHQAATDDGLDVQSGGLPVVIGNRPLLVSCIAELLENASKFGATRMTVEARTEGDWTYVTFADNGPGIDEGLDDAAFALFRLLQPKGRYPGVGAGLAIVRRTVEVHGGGLWLGADRSGGTAVVVRLLSAGPGE